ncbi:MAG: YifB family Mg chelatase-like AAA ATPase [Rickettsiales bacterium]
MTSLSKVSIVKTFAFQGLNVLPVDVEVNILPGLAKFTIVGLVDKIINEAKERVNSVINGLGIPINDKRIVVNLSPAGVIKEGSHFDLPIACAILCALGILSQEQLSNYAILGELSLDGNILNTPCMLLAGIEANANDLGIICSEKCGQEVFWSGNSDILLVNNLINIINHFKGTQVIAKKSFNINIEKPKYPDFLDVKCQTNVKRALQVAASGGHSVLMSGPPGAGKSMLAHRFCGIMPPLTNKEMLEVTMIYSAADMLQDGKIITARPFRSPHHSSTMPAIIGGGSLNRVKPGEISLAHNGVLFLDELPEFKIEVIDALRQPIESKKVNISRANFKVEYPANFQLIAAMNPCKCGYVDDPSRSCSKAPRCANDYQSKISVPMLDRFDIHIEVPTVDIWTIQTAKETDSTEYIAAKVLKATQIQQDRYEGYPFSRNNELTNDLLSHYINMTDKATEILNKYAEKTKISARIYNNILKVARTIADIDGVNYINELHIAESISYRKFY